MADKISLDVRNELNISDEEDEEEEVEPLLKYERLSNDLTNIFNKDAASCISANPKFLALGSHQGMVYIFDHLGNNIKNKELPTHSITVNQISIDENGDFLASCSDDGRILVCGLYSQENNHNITVDRPVKSVSLDPYFYKSGSGRKFVTGDDSLVLYEKTVFSRMRTSVIHEGDGLIRDIKWRKKFIAWANDVGVRVYDINAKCTISLIKRDHDVKYQPEKYRCHLCWKDDYTLLIGWADSIKICTVKRREITDTTLKDFPEHYIEISSLFNTDFYVSGIGWLEDNLVVLSYSKEESSDSLGHSSSTSVSPDAKRPQLRIIKAHAMDFTEVCTDILSLRGYQKYRCNDYHLEMLPQEGLFFILCPKDLVLAKPRDADDHITWLIDHEKFEEAMVAVKSNGKTLRRHNILQVGLAYLDYLLRCQQYDDAGRLCVQVLGRDPKLWQEEVFKFAKVHQLKSVAPYLPRGEGDDPKLEPAIYEMVLNEYLNTNLEGFHKLIKEWPSSLYNVGTVVNAVLDKLCYNPEDPTLLQAMGDLYTYQKKYAMALSIYLKLGNKDVFELIKKHNLFSSISDKIEVLMTLNTEMAIRMFLDHIPLIPISTVVRNLEKRTDLLYQYLDRLFVKDASLCSEYHGLQVKLYAEHNPKQLMTFLKSTSNYPLLESLQVCRLYHLVHEQVYLLARMGNLKEALQIITHKLEDIQKAIDFCKEHDDADLWHDLIDFSLEYPRLINILLRNIGTHVDPIILIQRIEKGVEVPGLRDSLVKILQDYNLQISLQEGCKKILVSDCYMLLERLQQQQRKGISVDEEQLCESCHGKLIPRSVAANSVVFHCRHGYHDHCLLTMEVEACPVCNIEKKTSLSMESLKVN